MSEPEAASRRRRYLGGSRARSRAGGGGAITNSRLAFSSAAALALVLAQFSVIRYSPAALPVRIVVPATIAAVPLALWPFRGRAGTWVIFVGLATNLAVILANGGLMPIERSSIAAAVGAERAQAYEVGAWVRGSKDVLVTGSGGRAVVLGDSIVVRLGGGRGIVASPGDAVILAGAMIFAAEASWSWQRARRQRPGDRPAAPAREGAQGGAATPQ